MKSNLYKNY